MRSMDMCSVMSLHKQGKLTPTNKELTTQCEAGWDNRSVQEMCVRQQVWFTPPVARTIDSAVWARNPCARPLSSVRRDGAKEKKTHFSAHAMLCRSTKNSSTNFQRHLSASVARMLACRLSIDGNIEWNSNLLCVDHLRHKFPSFVTTR